MKVERNDFPTDAVSSVATLANIGMSDSDRNPYEREDW